MIYYFGTLLMIWFYGTFGNVNDSKKQKKRYLICSFGLLILLMCLRKPTVGRDLNGHYAESFVNISSMNSFDDVIQYGKSKGYGVGYAVFNKLLAMISPDIQFFVAVTSIISVGIIGVLFYYYSKDVALSTFLFVTNCTYYMYFSMIRQALAISIVLTGYLLFRAVKKKPFNYLIFIAVILFASTFHSSALLCLIMLIFMIFNFDRKGIIIIASISILLFVFYEKIYLFTLGNFINDSHYEIYDGQSADSFGSVNIESVVIFLLSALPFLLGYYFIIYQKKDKNVKNKKQEYDLSEIESFLLFSSAAFMICRLLVFRMNIFGRLGFYFLLFVYVLYPYILAKVRKRSNYLILKRCIYGVYLLYYMYMTFVNSKLYYGVLPYEFFWN